MKKQLTVTAVMMLGLVAFAYGEDKPAPYVSDKVQLHLEIRWGGGFSTNPVKSFSNIPAYYRTVPWHPDDDSSRKRTTTIPDATINPGAFVNMNFVGSSGIMFKERLALRAGMGLMAANAGNSLSPGNTGHIRSVDIGTNTFVRGYGTSLVYNAVKYKDLTSPKPYFIPEVEVRVGPAGILLGAWQKPYEYVIERGYDRYNALQTLDQLPFASVTATHIYVGIRYAYIGVVDKDSEFRTMFGGMVFTVGPVKLRTHFAPNAMGTKIENGSGIMFQFSMGVGGPVKRWH